MKNSPSSSDKKVPSNNTTRSFFLNQNPFADSKLKEYEGTVLAELNIKKEFYNNELKKAEIELRNLQNDLKQFAIQSKNRENDLRNHIQLLSERVRTRDIKKVKPCMNNLHDEILKNISGIDTRSKDLIISKKTDIDHRINIRLMDSEYKFNNKLANKVNEKEETMRTFHENIKDMNRVRENYLILKDKILFYTKQNESYKTLIKDKELIHSKHTLDLFNLKRVNNILKNKIDLKKSENDSTTKNNTRKIFTRSKLNSRAASSNISIHEIKSIQSQNEKHKTNSANKQMPVQLDLEKITFMINDDEFSKKNPISCNIITSLVNVLENSKIRLNKLKKEFEDNMPNNNLIQQVCELITNMKGNNLGQSVNILTNRSKSTSNLFNNDIYMDKNQRKAFIDSLVMDKNIIDVVYDEKFKNISINERKLNTVK